MANSNSWWRQFIKDTYEFGEELTANSATSGIRGLSKLLTGKTAVVLLMTLALTTTGPLAVQKPMDVQGPIEVDAD